MGAGSSLVNYRLEGQVAIVTGGAGGIGREYCRGLARHGAVVVAADVSNSDAIVSEIRAGGGQAMGFKVDVSNEQSTKAMVAAVEESFGRIDVLVNNAAFYLRLTLGPFTEIPIDEWDKAFAVNVRGPWLCSRAVYPVFARQGGGKIINVSSTTVWDGTPGFLHYVATKAAMLGFTRALSREVGKDNIRVNTVTPDYTPHDPDFISRNASDLDDILTARRAFRRTQKPADMVGMVLYLASDASANVTGQNFLVNGGSVFQ
jgi:NAD(P)-dependent dehydrogenase (short-subunit alcohol dehydrogenase family)